MINTPAFESYKRYKELKDAVTEIDLSGGDAAYAWMLPYLHAAIVREKRFMRLWQLAWEEQLGESMERGKEE